MLTLAIALTGFFSWRAIEGQLGEMRAQRITTVAQITANMVLANIAAVPDKNGWKLTPMWRNAGATNAERFVHAAVENEYRGPAGTVPNSDNCDMSDIPAFDYARAFTVFAGSTVSGGDLTIPSERVQEAIAGTVFIILQGRNEFRDIFPESPDHPYAWCYWAIPNSTGGWRYNVLISR